MSIVENWHQHLSFHTAVVEMAVIVMILSVDVDVNMCHDVNINIYRGTTAQSLFGSQADNSPNLKLEFWLKSTKQKRRPVERF